MHIVAYMDVKTCFGALSEDTRLRLFRVLALSPQPLCVAELVDILQKPQYAVSRALAELRKAGLVEEDRLGRLIFYRRGSEHLAASLGDWVVSCLHGSAADSPARPNPDGSLGPGGEGADYDEERLRWRLAVRQNERVVVTYHKAPPEDQPKPRVLFVCVQNSARSQLAEELLRQRAGTKLIVESGGLTPGQLNPHVVRVLAEEGIPIEGKATRSVFDVYRRGVTYDWVITVCSLELEKNCPVFPGPVRRLSWPFPDPSDFRGTPEEVLAQVRSLARDIKSRVLRFGEESLGLSPGPAAP